MENKKLKIIIIPSIVINEIRTKPIFSTNQLFEETKIIKFAKIGSEKVLVTLAVNKKNYPNMEVLLKFLSKKIKLETGPVKLFLTGKLYIRRHRNQNEH